MKRLRTIIAFLALTAQTMGTQVLWAALDENATINGIPFREYVDSNGLDVNAARLSMGNPGIGVNDYAMEVVTQLALWIPEYEGDPAYWESEHPEICLKDEDGEYPMGRYSYQFDLGDNPNSATVIFFELGHIADWDDLDSPFITLATASDTIGNLIVGNYTYTSAIPWGPDDVDTKNWMPTQFRAITVPEPSTALLAIFGIALLLHRRNHNA